MELSQDLVGRLVAIQVARPLMVFEYSAHVKVEDRASLLSGKDRLLGQPIIQYGPGGKEDQEGARVATKDFFMGATVEAVGDDWLRFSMYDVQGADDKVATRVEHTVPTGLIMQIVEIAGFEVPTPSVTVKPRQPQSKLIL